jgi:hypothetical protein
MYNSLSNLPPLTAEQIEQNERCQARAYGMQRMDGWIVCSGRKIVSEILPDLEAARDKSAECIVLGMHDVSIHHVGGPYGQY